MTPEQRREVIWAPLAIWGGLLVLLAATAVYAYVPGAPIKTAMSLSIGLAKALLIALFFMQLRQASWLVRLAAIAGLTWVSFLYLIAFADYLTR